MKNDSSSFALSFFVSFGIIALVSSFNIEQRNPLEKVGPKNSLFGLSVALHHILENDPSPQNAILLVGAPTADRAPEHSIDSVKPGGLYKCEVTADEECTRVIVNDAESDEDISNKLFPDRVNTIRANSSNQWLGVRVISHKPGGKIAVCAHRYTIRGGARNTIAWEAAIGRCFLLENTIQPASDLLSFEWVPCLGKQDPLGVYTHEWYGYCQAGSAVEFADVPKNQDYNEEFIVFGAPGSFFWGGALYTSQSSQEFLSINLWTQEEPGDSVVAKNSLLGSSIATGNLLNSTTKSINFIAGAPGADVTGSVLIFEKRKIGFDQRLALVEIVKGDKVASRFGHEVKLVDVTGDGRLDLLVGAPQYYDREKSLGGAVYVYANKGLGVIGPTPTQKLFGNVDSSFGMSITSLGDINMDGANDIAIGAPGEDSWKGAIYIYHGNNQDGTIGVYNTPTQIIKAKELFSLGYISSNITGMGYSISGGLDMDFNGYPDFAAGSLSDSVIMFLSRPIVNIVGTLEVPDQKIVLGDNRNEKGYDIKICLHYTSSPSTFDEEVKSICTVQLDTARLEDDLIPRASFSSQDPSNYSRTFNMKLYPQSQNREKCKTIKAYLNDFQDKLSPIVISLNYTTADNGKITAPKRKRRNAGDISKPSPIMNVRIENEAKYVLEFSKDCGDDDVCRSKLSLTSEYEVLRGDSWESIEKNEDNIPVLKLGTEKQIGMVLTVKNPFPGEDAHQAQLKIILPNVLEYRSIEQIQSVSDLHCDPDTNNRTLVICFLGNPFKLESTAQFRVKFSKNKTAIYKSTGFEIQLQLQTTSQQPGHDVIQSFPVIVHVEAKLQVVGYASQNQIPFSGKVIGESAVKTVKDAGSTLIHTYEVKNAGTGPASNVELRIEWPLTLKNGKWLFYLIKVNVSDETCNCTLPHNVNPLDLEYVQDSPNKRSKRQAESVVEDGEFTPKEYPKVTTKAYEELACPHSASCIELSCSLGKISALDTVYVKFYALIWNSTFIEEYPGVSQIKVTSTAKVSINQNNIKYSEKSKLNDTVSIDILSQDITPPEVEVKWWIIAAATLAGVILLVFIILLLWKCGFFKRRKFGDYQKARKHKQASKKADERDQLY